MVENLFAYIALYTPLLPVLFFVLNWRKNFSSAPIRTIFLYCLLVDFGIGFATEYFHHVKSIRPALYASWTLFEYATFTYFIYLQLKNKSFKKFVVFISLAFLLFITVYYLTVKFKTIDSIPIGIETILILIFSFYFLYEELQDTTTLFIYYKPVFWVIFGITIYLAGSFFIYIYSESLSSHEGRKYWYITNIFAIIKNIFFSIAILIHAKAPKQKINYNNFDLSSLN